MHASLSRKPTDHRVWMLNRIINDTHDPTARTRLIAMLQAVETHPDADESARQQAQEFREYQTRDR